MHALAEQLKETFTKSGMTPEDLFNTFEKDGDGEIGKEEFKRMLMSLGANIQMKQIEDRMTALSRTFTHSGSTPMVKALKLHRPAAKPLMNWSPFTSKERWPW